MSLEAGTRIADLVPTNPVGATDFVSQGDDHIRLIKACLQGSFPSLGATAVAATAEQINALASMVAVSIIGRAANSTGAPAAITAAANDRILRRVADALDFGQLTAGMFPATVVPDAALSSNVPLKNAANSYSDVQTFGAQSLFPAGSVGAPSQAFTGAASTGRFLLSGEIRDVTNGGVRQIIGDTYVIARVVYQGVNGTAGAPSFSFENDADSGMYRAGADALGFATGGSNRATIGQGLYVGAPTGGDPGAGSINVSGKVQVNGEELGLKGFYYRASASDDNTSASDNGRGIVYVGAGGHTLTGDADIPANGQITVLNLGTGALTLAASGTLSWLNGGGSIPTGSVTLAVGGVCTMYTTGSGNYYVWGNGLS